MTKTFVYSMEVQKHCVVVNFYFILFFFFTFSYALHIVVFSLFIFIFSNLVNMYCSKWDCQNNVFIPWLFFLSSEPRQNRN